MGSGSSRNSGSHAQPNAPEKLKDRRPHEFENIISPEKNSDELLKRARSGGIFLDEETKKYWVDDKQNNCFMIFPKGMSITWGGDESYWSWEDLEGGSDDCKIKVAELLAVCWLEIHGKLELSYLNPEVTYEVFFEIMLANDDAYGWYIPVDLRLELPDGKVLHEGKENLDEKPKDRWLLLKAGEIRPQRGQHMEILSSLCFSAVTIGRAGSSSRP